MSGKRWVIQYTIGGPEYEGRYLTLDRDAEGGYTGTSRPVERVEDALRMTQSQADAIVALALGCKAIELPEGVA
jgi:hypothetical protein